MNETAPSKKSIFSVIRVLLLLALLTLAFVLYARYFNSQRQGGQFITADLSVFDARLQNLENSILLHEKRLKDLEESIQKQANTQQQPTSTPAPSSADEERIAVLEKQITQLMAASPHDNDKIMQSIRILSAFHRLSDKVIGGKPFTTELTSFESIAGPDESAFAPLTTLAPYADSGIPTFATLLVTFDQAVEGANAADAIPPATASFWERFQFNLAHLVTIRRIDDSTAGNSPDAIVSRAQLHLEREEVEAAAAEIKSLPDNVRSNFVAWLDDAQMVIEAPSLINQIEEQVMQKAFHTQPEISAPLPSPTPTPPLPAK